MNVIFLDIDGVLNDDFTNEFAPSGCLGVEDTHLAVLQKIIELTSAKVVLSSDWRLDRDDPPYNKDFKYLCNRLKQFNIELYDYTPLIDNGYYRGKEIAAWLSQNPEVEHYVIIDDWYQMDPVRDHFVKTNYHLGLREEHVERVLEFMKR